MLVAGIPLLWDIENGGDLSLGNNKSIAACRLGSDSENHIDDNIAK